MAYVRVCDSCKNPIDESSCYLISIRRPPDFKNDSFDFCPECFAKLKKFFTDNHIYIS